MKDTISNFSWIWRSFGIHVGPRFHTSLLGFLSKVVLLVIWIIFNLHHCLKVFTCFFLYEIHIISSAQVGFNEEKCVWEQFCYVNWYLVKAGKWVSRYRFLLLFYTRFFKRIIFSLAKYFFKTKIILINFVFFPALENLKCKRCILMGTVHSSTPWLDARVSNANSVHPSSLWAQNWLLIWDLFFPFFPSLKEKQCSFTHVTKVWKSASICMTHHFQKMLWMLGIKF